MIYSISISQTYKTKFYFQAFVLHMKTSHFLKYNNRFKYKKEIQI